MMVISASYLNERLPAAMQRVKEYTWGSAHIDIIFDF